MARIIISILLIFISFQSHSQIAMFHAHNRPPIETLLLDDYPNATVAYSFNRLRLAYTGNCIRVQRSSDNTQQDIGWDANNHIDTNALKTFVGANNGFIVTWYDQSGNGYNATGATASGILPRIINAGVIERNGGNVASRHIDANGGAQESYYIISSSIYAASVAYLYAFSAYSSNNAGFFATLLGSNPNLRGFGLDHPSSGRTRRTITSRTGGLSLGASTSTYTDGVSYVRTDAANRTNVLQWINGTSTVSIADRNEDFSFTGLANFILAGTNENVVTCDFHIMEFVLYAIDQSGNRSGIESKINSKLSIY